MFFCAALPRVQSRRLECTHPTGRPDRVPSAALLLSTVNPRHSFSVFSSTRCSRRRRQSAYQIEIIESCGNSFMRCSLLNTRDLLSSPKNPLKMSFTNTLPERATSVCFLSICKLCGGLASPSYCSAYDICTSQLHNMI